MFDLNEARNAARSEVKKIIDADPELSEAEVEEVRLVRENERAWTFTADIPKLIDEGWSPGAVIVLIDKSDGHVLTQEEQVEFHKHWEDGRRRAGFINQK
jgi:vacuolar-type H+-ATPase subunit E/Vma4